MKYWIRPASLTTEAKQDEISELFDKFNSVPYDDRVNRKSMSELEKTRMKIILHYLKDNKEINSTIAAELLKVEIKTASRLLSKAERLNILKGSGKTKNKIYFVE